jgi:hypothetical protein
MPVVRLLDAVLVAVLDWGCHHPRAHACEASKSTPADGVVVERTPDCLTLVRVSPAKFRFKILTALADGGARTAPDWAKDFQLAGMINASMFSPDLKSIGQLTGPDETNNTHWNGKLGGWLAFDPISDDKPPIAFGCEGAPDGYRSVVQDYRLLDCDGKPIAWKDPKTYSAAAIARDLDGNVVFVHARKAYAMTDFAKLLPPLGLDRALYVEGGPEASLVWQGAVSEVGSFESGFMPDSTIDHRAERESQSDSNTRFWPIPNVIGAIPR